MTKPYISKQKIRNFVSRVSSEKTDAIENEYEALLTQEIKSLSYHPYIYWGICTIRSIMIPT